MTTFDNTNALTHRMIDAKRFPMLTAEREQELARAWRDNRDEAALLPPWRYSQPVRLASPAGFSRCAWSVTATGAGRCSR